MTVDEIITAIDEFTYKPGYRLEAISGYMPGWVLLKISAHVPDSRGQTGDVKVAQVREIMSEVITSVKVLKILVRELVQRLESHESDEWLRFGGELVKDPHQ